MGDMGKVMGVASSEMAGPREGKVIYWIRKRNLNGYLSNILTSIPVRVEANLLMVSPEICSLDESHLASVQ